MLHPPSLTQLLRRNDVWRGHSSVFTEHSVLDTHYQELNQQLSQGGWPLSALIEICQAGSSCEWWLFGPAMRHEQESDIALLNPPALPFASGIKQLGIHTERFLVVTPHNAQDFIACFVELSQAHECRYLLAWQQNYQFSYSQIRKLQLHSSAQPGLCTLFRPSSAIKQSSPASLRMAITPMEQSIHIAIAKQKGNLNQKSCHLPIPEYWQRKPSHKNLEMFNTQYEHTNERY